MGRSHIEDSHGCGAFATVSKERMVGTVKLLSTLVVCALLACQPSGKDSASDTEASQVAGKASRAEFALAGPGEVSAVMREAVRAAKQDSRRLVFYVGASWCEPCRYFLDAVESNRLPERFHDLRFLKFDFDRDEVRLSKSGFGGQMLPRFVLPDVEGSATERRFEGSIKGPGAVDDLIAKLDWLLAHE